MTAHARELWLEHSEGGGAFTWLEWCERIDLREEFALLDAQAVVSMRRRAEILEALQGRAVEAPSV